MLFAFTIGEEFEASHQPNLVRRCAIPGATRHTCQLVSERNELSVKEFMERIFKLYRSILLTTFVLSRGKAPIKGSVPSVLSERHAREIHCVLGFALV